jgi:hypothetical protein
MLKEKLSELMDRFRGRKIAYCRVFDEKNQFANAVLMDLAKFCRAHDSTFHQDQRTHAVLEGRREVWLRIQNYLELDIEEIYNLLHLMKLAHKQS